MNDPITNAWLEAAIDLGIKVTAPFLVRGEKGESQEFGAHIAEFGSPKGIIACSSNGSTNGIHEVQGYPVSKLTKSYAAYDRQLFIDSLDDWGWFGDKGNAPSWYTGKPWT